MSVVNERIDRPSPTGVWSFSAPWRNTRRGYEVVASYAADTADVVGSERKKLPNSIVVTCTDADGREPIRFTRQGAESLRDALNMALEWEGE